MKFSLLSTALLASLCINKSEALWKGKVGSTWNYVLGNKINLATEKAEVLEIDVNKSAELIQEYHNAGKKVICYFSGGSYEHFRPDAKQLKEHDGLISYDDKLHGWDEYYLDIRRSSLRPIMKERIKLAKEKHCDGIEADNLDVCNNVKHLHLSPSDCVEYAKYLAQTAHDYDISIGLKNSRYIADKVAKDFDFAINESCFTHGEYCHKYKELFLDDGKAVFSINYNNYLKHKGGFSAICKHINGLPISMIVKESQTLKQDGWIIDSKICGSKFDNGIREVKTTTTTAAAAATSTAAAAANQPTTAATKEPAKDTKAAAADDKKDKPVAHQIVDEKEGGSGGVAAGVAVTVPVVGAAAAFIFAKKNPKQYENLKRSISHKATSVKNGATELSRRATQKASDLSRRISKKNQKTIDPTNETIETKTTEGTENNSSTESYRLTFTQQMEDLKFDGKLNIYQ